MDTINAFVTQVVGGDTVKIQVTDENPFNRRTYNLYEQVRLTGLEAPEAGTPASSVAKATLEKELLGKYVRLMIYTREQSGRLIATYSLS
ncbi:MAG: hypothetical protein J3T61_09270 [Candidatus Brocadiales bacterium]|nr:hypothetical protein [Candidatus Bathyanammoxibius sp.]